MQFVRALLVVVLLALAGTIAYYVTKFESYTPQIAHILDQTPVALRNLPQPAYQLTSLAESNSSIRFFVIRGLLRTSQAPRLSNLGWHFQTGTGALLLDYLYTDEEVFALWCYFYWTPNGESEVKGLDEASRHHFQKDLSSLTLEQTAYLVSAIRAPRYYQVHPEQLDARVAELLRRYRALYDSSQR